MEILSLQFLSALAAIVVIDLVLAGDNAIVIALAARNLPRHQQKRAIVWGTVGAIVVRTAMTLVVVWLLGIPGLLLAGGLLLVWIAYKLLVPQETADESANSVVASSLGAAIRTVIFADIVMGLDNVLAVAGAAHGSFLLVTLGLLISIPIVVWGSTMILKFIDRFPAFIYVGAGVLAFTAAKMISSEPVLRDSMAENAWSLPLLYVVTVVGVLWAGFAANHRRTDSKIRNRQSALAAAIPAHALDDQGFTGRQASDTPTTARARGAATSPGGSTVMKILVPVDDSSNSLRAIRRVAEEFASNPGKALEVQLLNVRPAFSRHIARFMKRRHLAAYQEAESERALRPARKLLEQHGIPFTTHIETGRKAEVIAGAARRLACDHIVMGTARKNSLIRMIEDSVTDKVLELASVPVEVVPGSPISNLQRYGMPAGIGAALGLMLLAAAD